MNDLKVKVVDTTNQHNLGYRTAMAGKSGEHQKDGIPINGYDVYDWPEFKAFMDRLGFAAGQATTDLIITIPLDKVVTIEQIYHAMEKE